MLISFIVENYRSIKAPVELSLAAVNYYKEQENQVIKKELPGIKDVGFLRGAAIFGANASGKSSILRAMSTMRSMVNSTSFFEPNKELDYQPFQLDKESRKHPTRFEIAFVADSIRYEYSFSYDQSSVLGEELSAYPKGRQQLWFNRETRKGKNGSIRLNISDSPSFRIPAAIKPLVNEKDLLLPLLFKYQGYKAYDKVMPLKKWFKEEFRVISRGPRSNNSFPHTGMILAEDSGTDYQRKVIQNFIRKADIGIEDAAIEETPFDMAEEDPLIAKLVMNTLEELAKRHLEESGGVDEKGNPIDLEDILPRVKRSIWFRHTAKDGLVNLDIDAESDGTFQLFVLSGYIAEALENGGTLIVDELDSSLHPYLVEEIVETFLSPEANPKGAQIVFSAHNPCLLDEGLLRRDQIWLTEKTGNGSTELLSLAEYNPRKDESVLRGYLTGRYSAVPIIPRCFGLCSKADEGSATAHGQK